MMEWLEDYPAPIAEALPRIFADVTGDDDRLGLARSGRPSFKVGALPTKVPAWLVWVILTIVKVPRLGRDEKLMWEFVIRFRGALITVSYEKFGLRAYVADDGVQDPASAAALAADLFHRIEKAAPIVEKHLLNDLLKEQLNNGHVTVANRFHHLRRAYEHFRVRSMNPGLEEERPREESELEGSLLAPLAGHFRAFELREVSGFDRAAAVNAYMSVLEHLLVFAFAFTDWSPAGGHLEQFMGASWREKWKEVVDLNQPAAKRHYDELVNLVEDVRHPASHGGFDRQKSLIYFHVPRLGAVPVQLSRAEVPPHFLDMDPNAGEVPHGAWAILDSLDDWLESGPLRFAYRWALAGLDMQFDPGFRDELKRVAADDDEFEKFLDHQARAADAAINMDWF
jgi:hypothetical protein